MERQGEQIMWGGAEGLSVIDLKKKTLIVGNDQAQISECHSLVEKADAKLIASAKALIAVIEERDRTKNLSLSVNPLTGPMLRQGKVLYVPAGRLMREKVEPLEKEPLVAAIREQRAELIKAIAASELSEHAQAARMTCSRCWTKRATIHRPTRSHQPTAARWLPMVSSPKSMAWEATPRA